MSDSTSAWVDPGDGAADRLVRLWRGGGRPDLDAFLAEAGPLGPGPLAAVLRADQRQRWEAGERVPAEAYLRKYASLRADAGAAIDLVYGEFLLRQQRGEAPAAEEYLWRFPEYAAVLGPQIERHRAAATGPGAGPGEATQSVAVPAGPAPRGSPARPEVPGYEILGEVGRGGMGVIYQARQVALGRDVALKELRPESAGHAALAARFLQEARITGQLEHPGVVPVYELVHAREGRQPFYTMRFVKGRTLSEAARACHDTRRAGRADALELPALLNAFVTVCNTVAYAHSRGVLHRDLKGHNVVLGDYGEVVVLDWGLAKVVGRPEDETEAPAVVLDGAGADGGHTVQGQALGTPAYMAPEQAAGRLDRIDRRTDVYGLGALLYEVLTGAPPFTGDSTEDVLRKVREEAPAPPRQLWPEVPPALEAVCLRALAKRPEDRPAAAADLAREVQGWQERERRKAEEALRRQTEILQSILNSMGDGVCVMDEKGEYLLWNRAAEKIVGLPLQEVSSARVIEQCFYLPDRVTPYAPEQLALRRAMRGEEVDDVEVFVRHSRRPEGVFVSISARPLTDARGVVCGGVSVFRDITARKHAEEELRKSRERFELAVAGSQDGLWDWDLITDAVYYSPRYKAMLGYEDHEFPDRSEEWAKRVHPDDLERVRGELRAHFKGRESLSWVEFRMRHKDGSYRWIRSRAFVLRDAAGRVYRMAGSHEDITERKNAEAELTHERYLLHSLMDTSPDFICFKDREGRYTRVNATFIARLGLSDAAQVIGKTVHDLFEAGYARQSQAEEDEILRTGQPVVSRDITITWPDGRTTWGSTTKVPLRDPQGQIIGTFVIARDVTKRKQAEAAVRESEERYRSVVAAMQDGVLLLDADGGIRSCNAAAERILGLSAEQMTGRTPHDPRWRAIHEDGSPFPGEAHPPMVTLRTGRPCTDVVMGVHKPDGTLTWITVNSQPLFRADGRTLAGVAASFEDVTDRKRTEEALRRTTLELDLLRQRLGPGESACQPRPGAL